MVYIDRKRVGIEEFFASVSPITSRANEFAPADSVEKLDDQPMRMRMNFAEAVNSALKALFTDKTIDVSNYINDDIFELISYPVTADNLERLAPLFEWLAEIQRLNFLENDRHNYEVNNAASRMDKSAGELLKACSNSRDQIITINMRDGDALAYLNEKGWGKASLVFPNVSTKFNSSFPIVGKLFCVDAEYLPDGGYSIGFTVDVEFGDETSLKRTLQDRNWVRLQFRCDEPLSELNLMDYGKWIADSGRRGHSFIDKWCEQLLSKDNTVGEQSLSSDEKELLPIACLFKTAYLISDINEEISFDNKKSLGIPDSIMDMVCSSYKQRRTLKLLEEHGETPLRDYLSKACEEWSCSDEDAAVKSLMDFSAALRNREREGALRKMYAEISDRMMSCTAAFDGNSRLYGNYRQAMDKVGSAAEPQLRSEGFSGDFPHYRRIRGKKCEFISILTTGAWDHSINATMAYKFRISAATKPLDKLPRAKKGGSAQEPPRLVGGIEFEKTAAEDFRDVWSGGVKFAELGFGSDCTVGTVGVDIFDSDEEIVSDEMKLLIGGCGLISVEDTVKVACDAMRGKKKPRWYRQMKGSVGNSRRMSFGKLLLKRLPAALYSDLLLTLVYLIASNLIPISDYLPQLTDQFTIVGLLVCCIALTVACCWITIRRRKNRIWWY